MLQLRKLYHFKSANRNEQRRTSLSKFQQVQTPLVPTGQTVDVEGATHHSFATARVEIELQLEAEWRASV